MSVNVPGTPLHVQRSEWVRRPQADMVILGVRTECHIRNVHDGQLRALVAHEPDGWHLSISYIDRSGEPTRYPTWDEIAHARYALLADELTMAMLLPPRAEYVDQHPTTFHLHEVDA